MTQMSTPSLLQQAQDEVEAELRRRFASRGGGAVHAGRDPGSDGASPPTASVSLNLLTANDWESVLLPITLADDITTMASHRQKRRRSVPEQKMASITSGPVEKAEIEPDDDVDDTEFMALLSYMRLRVAELPMRLQMEALQMRRYEHLLRQQTRELISLSECLALLSRRPPILLPSPHGEGNSASTSADGAALLTEGDVFDRCDRCRRRVQALEAMVRQSAEGKAHCGQRMVLLSEYAAALAEAVAAAMQKTPLRRRRGGKGAAPPPTDAGELVDGAGKRTRAE